MSITGEIKKEHTEKSYRAIPLLSASDLKLFSGDRKKFYKKYVLQEPVIEEYSKAILIGNLVHCLLLEPETFDEKYLMSTCEKPPTGLVLAFTEALYRQSVANMDEEGAIKGDFKEMAQMAYDEAGFKITLEAALKKFKETGQDYYEQLLMAKAKGLEICCMDDINIATKIVEQVKADPFVGGIFSNIDHCEIKIEGFQIDGVEMKGMIDKLVIDHEHETIQPIDLKIVFDNQGFYYNYYLKRQAYLQAYVYDQALKSRKADLGFDYSKYTILPMQFLAVDSGCFFRPLMYKLEGAHLADAYVGFTNAGRYYEGVEEILKDIKFSKETGMWNISKEAHENMGVLALC